MNGTPPLQKSSIHNVIVGNTTAGNEAQVAYNPFDHVRLPDQLPKRKTMVEAATKEISISQIEGGSDYHA